MLECGKCTECCTAFPVVELNKGAGESCTFIKNKQCSVYDERPYSCEKCQCAYIQMEKAAETLRPDKCGVIFERNNTTIIGTVVGELNKFVAGQIRSFKKEGFEVHLQKGVLNGGS